MAYCTESQIAGLLHDVTYLVPDISFSAADAIAAGQAWIDAYLESAGLNVPLTVAPTFVSLAAANYACYMLVRRKNRAGEFTDLMESFRRDALQMKDDFINGLADVPGTAAARENIPLPTMVNPHKKR